MKKTDLNKFFQWTRNGTCFSFTWLMFLVITGLMFRQRDSISTSYMVRLLILCLGGSIIFAFCFTKAFLRRSGFSHRLLLFFLVFGIYQSVGFWWLGIVFRALSDWLIYTGILMLCYSICKLGYKHYCDKYGAIYTSALNRYKQSHANQEN